jgi:Ca2+-binding RTX toxin-like protein
MGLCVLVSVFAATGTSLAKRTYNCGGQRATIVGTKGDDVLKGTSENDGIVGRGGADRIFGRAGADDICGNQGKDTIHGGNHSDWLIAGKGNDRLYGEGDGLLDYGDTYLPGRGRDHVDAQVDDLTGPEDTVDRLHYGSASGGISADFGTGTVMADGTDTVLAIDEVLGSPYGDTITLAGDTWRVWADAGDDKIVGNEQPNTIEGGAGSDVLQGSGGDDSLRASDEVSGNDSVDGGPGTDNCTADEGDPVSNCEA